jgi:acyl-CoA synthetase (AMP-forming)/AMP-acid ligase II
MSATTPYGERHLVHVLEERAAETPDRPCYSIANSTTDPTKGWRDVSYGKFANAVNVASQWLIDTFGRRGSEYEVFAYIGPNEYDQIVLPLNSELTLLKPPLLHTHASGNEDRLPGD